MSKIVRNKEQITATVTPYLKKRCVETAEGPDFTSISDIVTQALSEFFVKYDEKKNKETKKHEENIEKKIVWTLLHTKEGQDLLESFLKSNPKPIFETNELEDSISSLFLEKFKTLCNSIEERSLS